MFQEKGIYDKFIGRAQKAKYADFETDDYNQPAGRNHTWSEFGYQQAASDPFPTIQLAGATAGATTFWINNQNLIAIGARFYQETNLNIRNRIIVHEVLHLFYTGDHIQIMKKLGFGTYSNDSQASTDLNTWLDSDCTTKPHP